ncbi:amino acid transporter ANTL1-like protein [Cinnamomum micranthum f. kanehirae]|uniref:Amino acid transporter ANTL1-like protein n=1 Tax=Cinnamomum micranthum f. kanehirae TaxID=337451 RepID=A0A443P1H5_9MAGN|nr:amino acid transporter ANTL1-like protein [Cinnamomum micranthum f. kanehirae]
MGFEKEASSSSYTLALPDDTSPLLPKHPTLSSMPKTFANVFIAIVGAGVLGLPYTFMKTGWLAGLLMIFSVAGLTYHCMMLLVYTRRRIEESGGSTKSKITSFGDLGFAVCGPIGKFSVDAMIVLSQAGFCVSYVIFIANTLANVFNSVELSRILGTSPKIMYIWGMFPFQLGLNSIPTLTHLAPLSIFADVVDIGAMGVVMVEDVMVFLKDRPVLEAFGGFSVLFYGIGVAVYAFEGIGMVLPLESETADKKNFGKVLGLSMGFISLMYGSFGALGYFAFGQETRDIITINFGKGLISGLVQMGLCINLFFTFPLMMNPVHEVFERRFWGGRFCLWLRWVVVLAVCLVALLVPNFADFLSLVGSSVCIVLGFVLPALFHLIVFKEDMDWKGQCSLDTAVTLGNVLHFEVSVP